MLKMFAALAEMHNEADVEGKMVWPLLISARPLGLGFNFSNIKAKPNIRALSIGKRENAKLYYPDFVVMIAGLPVMIVEAKPPSDECDEGFREARLYAAELNASYPPGMNPVQVVICINGKKLLAGQWDCATSTVSLEHNNLDPADAGYAELTKLCSREILEPRALDLLKKGVPRPYRRPVNNLGGLFVRNEEIGHNSFGARVQLQYRHLFNPTTPAERAYIAKHAYIPSKRRDDYVDPIDRLIRAAAPPSVSDARLIENTGKPDEFISSLDKGKELENHIILLVGGVGSGKTTFVDYLKEVKLSPEVSARVQWVHLNMNYAPLKDNFAYEWVCNEIFSALAKTHPGVDFEDPDVLEKLFSVELNKYRKMTRKYYAEGTPEFIRGLVHEITELQRNLLASAKAMARYSCSERGKLLIVAFDNCDKRVRDEQLFMFQLAQWLQREFRCLIILPLRDVTYDHYRSVPPLDTALKDFVFRIEPPLFSKVLHRRLTLALEEMRKTHHEKVLSYKLPTGVTVEYPAEDLGVYLACILKSVFEYDRFVRRIIMGLAGRDMRRAMEIFLDFVSSGHITEDEIMKIRYSKGDYCLPLEVITRVLLRQNRRFYDGDASHVKNLFQCRPEDERPSHFIRVAILRWLSLKFKLPGPTRVSGYHRVKDLIGDLIVFGLTADQILREIVYLLKAKCVNAEHMGSENVADDDLVCIAPAGDVHLGLLDNYSYIAACAEDAWITDSVLADRITSRIVRPDSYHPVICLRTAHDFTQYLFGQHLNQYPFPEKVLSSGVVRSLTSVGDVKSAMAAHAEKYRRGDPWFWIEDRYPVGGRFKGAVRSVTSIGIFVDLEVGVTGLIWSASLEAMGLQKAGWPKIRDLVSVVVERVDGARKRIRLNLVASKSADPSNASEGEKH
jgi:hypothetical protein